MEIRIEENNQWMTPEQMAQFEKFLENYEMPLKMEDVDLEVFKNLGCSVILVK